MILNTAFGHATIAVDTHIFRVANRTGLAPDDNVRTVEDHLVKVVPEEYAHDAHHWLILHGRYTCIARKPKCPSCVILEFCEYKQKTKAEEQPVKRSIFAKKQSSRARSPRNAPSDALESCTGHVREREFDASTQFHLSSNASGPRDSVAKQHRREHAAKQVRRPIDRRRSHRRIGSSGKTAVVTGCNSGIGFETMRVLALRGAHVIGTARTLEKGREACGKVKGRATPVVLELTDFASVVAAPMPFAR